MYSYLTNKNVISMLYCTVYNSRKDAISCLIDLYNNHHIFFINDIMLYWQKNYMGDNLYLEHASIYSELSYFENNDKKVIKIFDIVSQYSNLFKIYTSISFKPSNDSFHYTYVFSILKPKKIDNFIDYLYSLFKDYNSFRYFINWTRYIFLYNTGQVENTKVLLVLIVPINSLETYYSKFIELYKSVIGERLILQYNAFNSKKNSYERIHGILSINNITYLYDSNLNNLKANVISDEIDIVLDNNSSLIKIQNIKNFLFIQPDNTYNKNIMNLFNNITDNNNNKFLDKFLQNKFTILKDESYPIAYIKLSNNSDKIKIQDYISYSFNEEFYNYVINFQDIIDIHQSYE